jgi:hypothetical protein
MPYNPETSATLVNQHYALSARECEMLANTLSAFICPDEINEAILTATFPLNKTLIKQLLALRNECESDLSLFNKTAARLITHYFARINPSSAPRLSKEAIARETTSIMNPARLRLLKKQVSALINAQPAVITKSNELIQELISIFANQLSELDSKVDKIEREQKAEFERMLDNGGYSSEEEQRLCEEFNSTTRSKAVATFASEITPEIKSTLQRYKKAATDISELESSISQLLNVLLQNELRTKKLCEPRLEKEAQVYANAMTARREKAYCFTKDFAAVTLDELFHKLPDYLDMERINEQLDKLAAEIAAADQINPASNYLLAGAKQEQQPSASTLLMLRCAQSTPTSPSKKSRALSTASSVSMGSTQSDSDMKLAVVSSLRGGFSKEAVAMKRPKALTTLRGNSSLMRKIRSWLSRKPRAAETTRPTTQQAKV